MSNNNQKIFRLIAVLMPLAFAMIAAVFAYGKYTEKVNQLEATSKKTQENTEAIIELRTDIKYIKLAVDRIERKIE